ncbi:polyprenyl synthetase family protein [Listeria ivanovii]|uniref:Farnesyl diphosphate synthase n=1 Tax=Listeria ivanovii (strain ATCC BAA-678 / PAM 55) TaxID=881621 RepID=G2Z8A2_LISIP|nr:farnesyl diphosphate synthase [Listeria ivanovii]AHI55858.1 geranyltranstransferase [Listeria ivanovii WSLC3009]AIS65302.1 geranyl transferase [Listeria ivanovii subsp. ivanovii]MBC1760037.1 polyprenyl synthetase family protein [Listeria ivanovii]MBK3914545.1 polyprenyl synthetase family protein [Listeria ivanovii subsp. ivanovii]MBK3921557.1 polyprenyl synthetase family protein [Listeria ivanovii subsp. ivanovii]
MQDLSLFLEHYKKVMDESLFTEINKRNIEPKLKESMLYSVQAGGKRIRPMLVFATLQALNTDPMLGVKTATALEMIHTYSLIHDDLPAMDNDDYRRGKWTNHKVYGDATAILAGDALLTLAFSVLAEDANLTFETRIALISELSFSSGAEGMVGGQQADMEAENNQVTLEELASIHARKTGELLIFAVTSAAKIAEATPEQTKRLRIFAENIGVGFQISDDILDVIGDEMKMGKKTGGDAFLNKSTYPGLLTLDGAKRALNEHVSIAKLALSGHGFDDIILLKLADLIAFREN